MQQQPNPESPFADAQVEPQRSEKSRRWSPQFGLGWMMLVLTVVAAAAAPLAYLARGLRGSRSSLFVFILFCLAAPPALLIVVSALHHTICWFNKR